MKWPAFVTRLKRDTLARVGDVSRTRTANEPVDTQVRTSTTLHGTRTRISSLRMCLKI